MSIVLTNCNGRADMGASPPTLSAYTRVLWYYQNSANYYDRKGIASISTTTNDRNSATHFTMVNQDGVAQVAHRNGSTALTKEAVGNLSKGSWQMLAIRASSAANTIRIRRNGSGGEASETLSGSNPMAAFRYLTIGAWEPDCSTANIAPTSAIAHDCSWNYDLSDGDLDSLYNSGGTSINPTTVRTSDIIAYWSGASLTAEIGGYTYSSVQGTLSLDSGNNPDVAAYTPPGGSAIAAISHYYRMMRSA